MNDFKLLSELHLIKNTGICAGNYKYFASKKDCDDWFLSKSQLSLEDLSVIRPDTMNKNAYNVMCVHIPLAYDELTECDYISFKNANYERWFHAQVVDRELVNQDSTRLYFDIDYVASYWDTIEIGKSFVERTHVGGDFSFDQTTASKYLLPEPFPIEIRHRPELLIEDPFNTLNEELHFTRGKYNLNATIDIDGNINKPEIKFQCGSAITGYLYTGESSDVEQWMSKYVTYTARLINRSDSILNYISSIYICPETVTGEQTQPVIEGEHELGFRHLFNHEALPAIRHAKVYDYFRVKVFSQSGEVLLSPAEYKSTLRYVVYKTGGPDGKYTMQILNDSDYTNQAFTFVSTASWPHVSYSVTTRNHEYETATPDFIAKEWAAKEARKRVYNGGNG